MINYIKPIPIPSIESRPYWVALREHRLIMQSCDACETVWFPPSVMCPHCLSTAFKWRQLSGRGKVFSFVVYHRAYHPGFVDELPYAVAVIQLEEGPRMISNVVGISHDAIVCDMAVEVTFEDITDDVTLPKFTPAKPIDGR